MPKFHYTQGELVSPLLRKRVPFGWRPDECPDFRAMGVREIALDLETTGLKWYAGDRPIGIAVAWAGGEAYLPFGHRGGGNLDEATVRRWASEQLPGLMIRNLNTKFDAHHFREWYGADLADMGCGLGDVTHSAALLDDHRAEGWRRADTPFSLEAIGRDYAGEGKLKGLDPARMADYHASEVADYARQDARLVIKVWAAQRPMLERRGLLEVQRLEDQVLPVVVEMEYNAARIDVEKLHRWNKETEQQLGALRLKLANQVGWAVNPDSPEHMARLFRELGLQSDKLTDTGRESFASSVLAEHAGNPAIENVIKVSRLSDLRAKFIVPYAEAVGDDGLLRFEFHQLKGDQYGTVSGRFSSSKPQGAEKGANVQQVFAVDNQLRMHCSACAAEWGQHKDQVARHRAGHGEAYIIRELFVPDEGMELGTSDAEQIEYRVFSDFSKSPRLLKAYEDDPHTDFHEWSGAEVRKHRPDFERKRLKVLNFSLLFGSGVSGTRRLLNVGEAEAIELRDFYFNLFPEAKSLMDLAMNTARSRGYVKTITGRQASFPQAKRLHAALNRAIQGTAADLNKMKLVSLYCQRKELGIKLRMTVHDEVVVDIAKDAVPAWAAAMDVQEWPLKVPILWSTKSAKNWAEAK